MLTVTTVRDLELPIINQGPEVRNQTIVFTEIDKNTKIYAGQYKNTVNFDRYATFQGSYVGGMGVGTAFLNPLLNSLQPLAVWYEIHLTSVMKLKALHPHTLHQ